jgi:hypothetical protein
LKLATRGHNGRWLRGERSAQVVVKSGEDDQILLGGLGGPLELEGGKTQSEGLPGQRMIQVLKQNRRRNAGNCLGWESHRDGLGAALCEVTRGGLGCNRQKGQGGVQSGRKGVEWASLTGHNRFFFFAGNVGPLVHRNDLGGIECVNELMAG